MKETLGHCERTRTPHPPLPQCIGWQPINTAPDPSNMATDPSNKIWYVYPSPSSDARVMVSGFKIEKLSDGRLEVSDVNERVLVQFDAGAWFNVVIEEFKMRPVQKEVYVRD